MLHLSYKPNIHETATATLDFIENRPILKFSLFNMKLICFITISVYIASICRGNISWLKSGVTVAATAWLFFRRKLNYFILHRSLVKNKLQECVGNLEISKHKKLSRINSSVIELGWCKISCMYQNKNGYIIPIPGISNGGRFIWLPLRSFTSTVEHDTFLDIVKERKLKIKVLN